jgi:HSP20 family molecular chaperone IbpA
MCQAFLAANTDFDTFFGDDSYRVPYTTWDYDEETGLITITVETPGAKKDDIEIKATEHSVLIATKETDDDQKTSLPKYKRRLTFKYKIKPDNVKASYSEGILTLKIERELPQKFTVKID